VGETIMNIEDRLITAESAVKSTDKEEASHPPAVEPIKSPRNAKDKDEVTLPVVEPKNPNESKNRKNSKSSLSFFGKKIT